MSLFGRLLGDRRPGGRWLSSARLSRTAHSPPPDERTGDPSDTIAALDLAVADHKRLVEELERAAAAHREAVAKLTGHMDALRGGRPRDHTQPAATLDTSPVAHVNADLTARLLGPFEVRLAESVVGPWRSHKAASLLKYLLLNGGRPVRREALMDAFWPGSSAKAARNNLNVTVYSLRRTLHAADPARAHVLFNDGAYLLSPELTSWLDTGEFRAASQLGHRCFERGELSTALEAYRHARSLFRGPLLDGDASGEWFQHEQRRMDEEHNVVLERLGLVLLQLGELSESVEVGTELLAGDPCRETGHQLLMRAYGALQQPQMVVRQYERCLDALRRQLQVEPDPMTVALFHNLVVAR